MDFGGQIKLKKFDEIFSVMDEPPRNPGFIFPEDTKVNLVNVGQKCDEGLFATMEKELASMSFICPDDETQSQSQVDNKSFLHSGQTEISSDVLMDTTEVHDEKVDVASRIQNQPTVVAPSQNDNNLPFVCELCSERFHKKLLLNNHVETRHGIKYVFTQKGYKVKLVRMPENITEGDKMDPCVKLLLQASDTKQRKNIIGVQAMDGPDQQINYQSQLHQEINTQELLKNRAESGMGILVGNICFPTMQAAIERGDTPFAVFRPLNSKKNYLLTILKMNSTRQLLYPTTQADLNKCYGLQKEEKTYLTKRRSLPLKANHDETEGVVNTSTESHDASASSTCPNESVRSERETDTSMQVETPGSSGEFVQKTRQIFSNIAVVAIAKQVLDKETGKCVVELEPSYGTLENVELCNPKQFVGFGIQCKVKRLRCYTETSALISSPPAAAAPESPKPKRKYMRKSAQAATRKSSSSQV